MKKLFGFLLVAGMVSTAFVSKSKLETSSVVLKDGIEFQKSSYDEAIKAAKKSGKLIFIDAYTEWCGPCKKMAPYLDKMTTELKDNVIIIRIDVDKNEALANELKIEALPTLMLYENKKVTWQTVGFITEEDLRKKL